MLNNIKIKNMALIKDAEIEFLPGLNIISGETGSGKSVIINAVNILLGKRTDKSIIRQNEPVCEISGIISLEDKAKSKLLPILNEHNISIEDDSLLIRKIITPTLTKNYVNDVAVTLNTLSNIRDILIDFHGPNQNHLIQIPSYQLDMLDDFAILNDLRESCSLLFKRISEKKNELKNLTESFPRQDEIEFFKKSVKEVDSANLREGEDEELNERYSLISNSKSVAEILSAAKYEINESDFSIYNHLVSVNKKLYELKKFDLSSFEKLSTNIEFLIENLKELSNEIENFADSIELDENQLAELENRINTISSLKRKYGKTLKDVQAVRNEYNQKIEMAENFDSKIQETNKELNSIQKEYSAASSVLSKKRKDAALIFSEKIKKKLQILGFLKSDLTIEATQIPPTINGIDKIDILFSPNPGESPKSLKEIASSGEISRVMLAIKTVISDNDAIPIMVFDEIDVNIGGEVAFNVGTELYKIGQNHQVICISHLPQVASFADNHIHVKKESDENRTLTKIKAITHKDRVSEISRMLGGGEASIIHAEEIINKSEKIKAMVDR